MKVKGVFYQILQNSQDAGTTNDHLVSRLYFRMLVGDKAYNDMYADVKQPAGTDFSKETVEVCPPQGSYHKRAPWNHEAFRDAAEEYCRSTLGHITKGLGSNMGGASFIMRNNLIVKDGLFEFDIPD